MADISQIKIGTTVYDICDTSARNFMFQVQSLECNGDTASLNSKTQRTVYWRAVWPNDPWGFLSYRFWNTDSIYVYVVTLSQKSMVVANGHTSAVTHTPHADQLYYKVGY